MKRRIAWWAVRKSLTFLLNTYHGRFGMLLAEIRISSEEFEYAHSVEVLR